jgi:hypothetical protein
MEAGIYSISLPEMYPFNKDKDDLCYLRDVINLVVMNKEKDNIFY